MQLFKIRGSVSASIPANQLSDGATLLHLRIILPFSESSTSITLVDVARAPRRPRISHFRPSIASPNNVTEGSGALCPCMNFNRAGGGARQIVCSGHVNRRKEEAQRVEKKDGSRQEKRGTGKTQASTSRYASLRHQHIFQADTLSLHPF